MANGLIFFLAGYETTANTMSFIGYHLATNTEIQDKLTAEIDEIIGEKVGIHRVISHVILIDLGLTSFQHMVEDISQMVIIKTRDAQTTQNIAVLCVHLS